MNSIEDTLKKIVDPGYDTVKQEFSAALKESKEDGEELVKETATRVELWLSQLATKEISEEQFKSLLKASRNKIEQWINKQEIDRQTQVRKTIVKVMDIAVNKLVAVIIAAV